MLPFLARWNWPRAAAQAEARSYNSGVYGANVYGGAGDSESLPDNVYLPFAANQ